MFTLSRLRFDRGPTSGGTSVSIDGSSFRGGSAYRCRFDASEVNDTYVVAHDELHCLSPAAPAGTAVVEVSLNGQQFSSSGVAFEYYVEARVSQSIFSSVINAAARRCAKNAR